MTSQLVDWNSLTGIVNRMQAGLSNWGLNPSWGRRILSPGQSRPILGPGFPTSIIQPNFCTHIMFPADSI